MSALELGTRVRITATDYAGESHANGTTGTITQHYATHPSEGLVYGVTLDSDEPVACAGGGWAFWRSQFEVIEEVA